MSVTENRPKDIHPTQMVLSVRLLKFADLAQVSWKLLLLVRELKLLAAEKREAD